MDFGVLSALAGQDNWNAIRQGKARDLQLMAMQEALQNQEMQKSQADAMETQNYLNTINQLKVMGPDKQRIQDYEETLREPIKEGIRAANGDVSKWLDSGGKLQLAKYRNDLISGEPTQTGLMNALNHQQYLADSQAGLIPREVGFTDDSGNTVSGNYLDQFNLYRNGKINKLSYNGGYKRPEGNPAESFSKIYGSENRYAPTPVNPQDLKQWWIQNGKSQGLSPRDAEHYGTVQAQQYLSGVQQGAKPYFHKWDDPSNMIYHQQQIELAKQRLQLQKDKLAATVKQAADPYGELFSGSNGQLVAQPVDVNSYSTMFGLPEDSKAIGQESKVNTSYLPIYDQGIIKEVASAIGLKEDSKTKAFVGRISGGDQVRSFANLSPATGDLNTIPFDVKNIEGVVSVPSPDQKSAKSFIVANVHAKAGDWDKLGMYNHHWWWPDSEKRASQGQTQSDGVFSGGRTMKILIPMPADKLTQQRINSQLKNLAPKYNSGYGQAQSLLGQDRFTSGAATSGDIVNSDALDNIDITEEDIVNQE